MNSGHEIRKLNFADGAGAEKLVRLGLHSKGRLSLHHEPNLFNFYRFVSLSGDLGDVNFWGAFGGQGEMIGLSGFVNYELNLTFEGMKCFYNGDALVVPEERGKRIYLEFLDKQTEFFHSREFVPLSWGIEHSPGKLEGMKTYLEKKGGMEVRFLGHTRGFHIFLSHALDTPAHSGGFKKIFLKDSSAKQREEFLSNLKDFRQASALFPRIEISFFDRILRLDPQAYFVLDEGNSGLLAVDLNPIRQYFKTEDLDPLATLHWSMFWSRGQTEEDLRNLFSAAYQEALSDGVEVVVVRDIPLGVVKLFREVAMEPRRVFAVTRKRDRLLFEDLEQKVKNVELDSLFV